MTDQIHHVVDLDLEPHEASGLAASQSDTLRERVGWDPLYWTVLDDGPVQDCIALIGQRAGSRDPTANWGSTHLQASPSTSPPRTHDGEAITIQDGWVHVIGSAYGSKDGPLEPERGFVARFHEDDVVVEDGVPRADLHVVADPFVLHRVVNDALHDSGVELMAWSHRYRKKTIRKARRRAVEDEASWAWRLAADDSPINIEGAVFTDGGGLLLGLRAPVSRMGHALLVEVREPERLFDPALDDPEPGRVIEVTGYGDRRAPVGVRDLARHDDRLHVLVGNLDSDPEDSILLQEHPEGGHAVSAHLVLPRPSGEDGDGSGEAATGSGLERPACELVREFEGLYRVEGVAADVEGRFVYVSDEDDSVRTRFFASGPASVHADGHDDS